MTIVESLILIYTLLVAQAAACIYKLMNKEICKLCNIYISLLITRAIVGSAVLCDVKLYQSKKEFVAEQSNP
jgi:4-hydroxybenzoate polyprenyltransferase